MPLLPQPARRARYGEVFARYANANSLMKAK